MEVLEDNMAPLKTLRECIQTFAKREQVQEADKANDIIDRSKQHKRPRNYDGSSTPAMAQKQ